MVPGDPVGAVGYRRTRSGRNEDGEGHRVDDPAEENQNACKGTSLSIHYAAH